MSDPEEPTSTLEPAPSWSVERILPEGFLPMLATTAAGPMDSLEHMYEVKWEGLRVLAGFEASQPYLRSGAGQDALGWFPEVAAVRQAAQPDWVLLDGELVVLEEDRPSLTRLQQRLLAPDEATVQRLMEEAPALFVAYDVLRIGDSWLLDVNWEERRDILERIVTPSPAIRLSPAHQEGVRALERVRKLGLESVVAKRLRGRYVPGERTRDWLSIKPREVVEAIICGWTEGRGSRGGTIGTLLLGMLRGRKLIYIGHTGTGLDAETLRTLHQELVARGQSQSPFAEAPPVTGQPHWVRPELVCRVRHQGWKEGGKMSSPTFMELAQDLAPAQCRLPEESEAAAARRR